MPAKLMSDVSSPQAMPEHVRSITLIRHGRTSYNARHCFQGQIDIPLDEIGEWQVRQTAQALRSLYVESHPERRQLVVASDLSRAMATAHAFADPLGLVVHPDARVRERNFGEWEGKELAELDALSAPLAGYHPYHAARAELLRRLGRHDEAAAADLRALSLTGNDAEQRLLRSRLPPTTK